jgi:hypothetical protein
MKKMRKLLVCNRKLPKELFIQSCFFPQTKARDRYQPFKNTISQDKKWASALLNYLSTCEFSDRAYPFNKSKSELCQILVSSKTKCESVENYRFRLSVPMHCDPEYSIMLGVVHSGEGLFGLFCNQDDVTQIALTKGHIFLFDSRLPHDFTPHSKKVDMTLIELKSLKTKLIGA